MGTAIRKSNISADIKLLNNVERILSSSRPSASAFRSDMTWSLEVLAKSESSFKLLASDLDRFGEHMRRMRPPFSTNCENANGARATIALEKNPAARS